MCLLDLCPSFSPSKSRDYVQRIQHMLLCIDVGQVQGSVPNDTINNTIDWEIFVAENFLPDHIQQQKMEQVKYFLQQINGVCLFR